MKRIIILTVLFFTILCTSAQNKIINRQIKWEKPRSVSHYFNIEQKKINKTTFLYFENANYNAGNFIPYYYELISLNSKNSNFTAEITGGIYKSLSEDELLALQNKELIPGELQYDVFTHLKRKQVYLQIKVLPLRKNKLTGNIEKLTGFKIEIKPFKPVKNSVKKKLKFNPESVLRSGNWVKVGYKKTGIYKITYAELVGMGVSNPENLRVYGNISGMLSADNNETPLDDLVQNAIYFNKGADGVFNEGDYILTYAKGPDEWEYNESNDFFYCKKHIYSEKNYLFLTSNTGSLLSISSQSAPSGSATETVSTFTDFVHHEEELDNLIKSGQLWVGEKFDITTNYSFDFSFPNLIKSNPVQLKSSLVARSSLNTSFDFKYGGSLITNQQVASVDMSSYTSQHANIALAEGNFNSSSDNFSIDISFNKSTSSSEGWLNFLTLNAKRQLKLVDGKLFFRYYNAEVTPKIIEFQITNTGSNAKVWSLLNPNKPANLNYNQVSSSTISVKVEVMPGVNEFVAFNTDEYMSVEVVGSIENQNLHSIGHRDMIIVSHPEFLSQANQIADIHKKNDGLSVEIVTPDKIFNEFSSGTPDASAIRNFAKMIYDRATTKDTLKYLLLIGDGSYDHKSITAENINYIMTYQSVNSLNPTASFVTDDFFGLLDETDNIEAANSGLVDIGVGRFPVKTDVEAQQMTDKIKSYLNKQNKGDWINSICFTGDDEDNNLHMKDADKLAEFVDTTYPYFFVNKIYLDAYPQESSSVNESYPEVNRLVNDQINNGVLIFNYTGHGGVNGLAHERIISADNILSWKNMNKLAVFMTATCEFSRFDTHQNTSAGELVILNPEGGGVALFTTTRLVYSSPNYTLNRNFYNYVFERDSKGKVYAMGDIIRLAKNASGTENNKRNFTLLGDPALKMPLPQYRVLTDSINGVSITEDVDTLKALSKVTIHGHIENNSNALLTNYNGIVYPIVLDKEKTITTLGNDGGSTMDFNVQNNILYKGKASVVNGKFKFTFVVPKDISYNFGNGKISYYSLASGDDAKGYFTDFVIGGSNENAVNDDVGPDIKLYMNDENFVSGGVTDENPTLYAVLQDSSGINTVGNGIGHDITVILDDNTSEQIVLNDYYESELDNYQKGKIEYLFSELENGEHSLKMKVWDVYNNSSEKELEFFVAESENLMLKNIFNYPNPFTENTSFFFDHNRPNEDLEVLIQIFTISGKLVKTIHDIINSNAFRSEPVYWDGLDDFGDRIGRGVYIYQLKVRSLEGEVVKKTEKLVILK